MVRRFRSRLGGQSCRSVCLQRLDSQAACDVNWRELRVIHLTIFHFRELLQGRSVGLFCNNTTDLAYLKKQGGTFSQSLNTEAEVLLRWTESLSITLLPQFFMGARNVVADSLSRRLQVLGSEWTLAQVVVDDWAARHT